MGASLARRYAKLTLGEFCIAAPKIGEDLDSWLMPGGPETGFRMPRCARGDNLLKVHN